MKPTNWRLGAAWGAAVVALWLADSHSALTATPLMYVSNYGNGTIAAVAADGGVSTFATGLHTPTGLALDRWGNLYAADYGVGGGGAGTINKITPDGHVSTWVSGLTNPNGLAFDAADNLYAAVDNYGTTANAIIKITPSGSISVFATTDGPCDLAFDGSGNLFVANYWLRTISKVTPGGTVSTFASGFSGRLDALAFDAAGDLYVVNLDGYVVQRVTPGGSISTFATGQSWPGGCAFDRSGNLYLAEYLGNRIDRVGPAGGSVSTLATGFSNPHSIAMVPQSPSIVTQPQGRTAQAGSSVSLGVVATGTSPLSYQWRKDGASIAGASSPGLTLTSVSAGDSGGYSVTVRNASGSVVSATASLAILTDGAAGSLPTQVSTAPPPTKPPAVDSLVIVTHGFEPFGVLNDVSWVSSMADAIRTRAPANWLVIAYTWQGQAWGTPGFALINARIQGGVYAAQLAQQNWQHVHLIGHSAGSAFVEAAAKKFKEISPGTVVHSTFLDPYLSFFLVGTSVYGANADWADCYFAQDTTGNFTKGPLENAYSVDVTWADPNKQVSPVYCSSSMAGSTPPVLDQTCGQRATSSHGYPHDFYLASITGATSGCASGYGFAMSKEGGGWGNRGSYPVGNQPLVLCGPPAMAQNPFSFSVNEALQISALPSGTSVSGVGIFGGGFSLTTHSPSWLAAGVAVTNPVNFVQFDAGFTSTNGAQGLLTVYWNTNSIGMVDERVALTDLQSYRFALPSVVTNGVYTLSFRLDPMTNTTSSITVTNVKTGFSGVLQPMQLGMTLAAGNNTPLLMLSGAPNYNYLIEGSTNLTDWAAVALLVNTNGEVFFADPAVTNLSRCFYRATMP